MAVILLPENNIPFTGGYIHIEGMFPMDKYLLAQSSSGEDNISFHKGLSFAKCYVFLGYKWYIISLK